MYERNSLTLGDLNSKPPTKTWKLNRKQLADFTESRRQTAVIGSEQHTFHSYGGHVHISGVQKLTPLTGAPLKNGTDAIIEDANKK